MANLKDVAEMAGVSLMTASRVLNGKGYVSEEKRVRVMECARKLKYRPNMIARSLVLNRTATVGILVCHLENPVYAQYVASISETLRGHGMDIILYSAETERTWLNGIRTLVSKQVDGLILASAQFDGVDEKPMPWNEARRKGIAILEETEKPYVIIGNNGVVDGEDNQICPDYYTCLRMTLEHLIEMGHRKIGYYHFRKGWQERLNAVRDVMAENGLSVPPEWDFSCDSDVIVSACTMAEEWLEHTEELPTAVCCDNDTLAVGLLQALHQRGIRVPDQISVTGNDGNIYSLCTSPRLTTASIQPWLVGNVAAERLLELLKDPLLPKQRVLTPPEFQKGGTVRRISES